MSNTTFGTGGTAAGHTASPLLDQVRQATTIGSGLSTMRSGIANLLIEALGPQITRMAQDYNPGGDHRDNYPGITAGLKLDKLQQLYMGLVSDDESWSEAITANTPQATADQEAGVTASRTAFA